MATEREADRPRLSLARQLAAITMFLLAVAAVVVAGLVLRDAGKRPPVAAGFTRVGGPTRVETALEASRFWLTTPRSVVTISTNANPQTMRRGAHCAMVQDAPLIFRARGAKHRQHLNAAVVGWRRAALQEGRELMEHKEGNLLDCLKTKNQFNVQGLSVVAGDRRLPGPKAEPGAELDRHVVFAAAKSPADSPDVAVGLALASHLADHNRDVSLVVVPRYLQASPELENQLRGRRELIEGGVLLGQTGILSEDTRALLRQVLTASDRRGFLGAIETTFGRLEALVAAFIALLGLGIAARTGPPAIQAGEDLFRQAATKVGIGDPPKTSVNSSPAARGDILVTSGERVAPSDLERTTSVWLRSRPPAIDTVEGDVSGKANPTLRRAGLRLGAEIVASLAGSEILPPFENDPLLKMITAQAATKSGASTSDHVVPPDVATDLLWLLRDAEKVRDVELHAALYAVTDCLRLVERWPRDQTAYGELSNALTELVKVSDVSQSVQTDDSQADSPRGRSTVKEPTPLPDQKP